jgi:hypothetical protein
MTFELFMQSVAVIFALLAGWAWIKSAMRQLHPDKPPTGWTDKKLDTISRRPEIWNAIAAFLSAGAAIAAAVAYMLSISHGHR